MSLIDLVFKLGRILAMTPTSTTSKTNMTTRKVYIVMMAVLVTSAWIRTLFRDNFYLNFKPIKTVVMLLSDSTLLALNCYGMLSSGLTNERRRLWNELIKRLKITASLTRVDDSRTTSAQYWVFVVGNAVEAGMTVHVVFLYYDLKGDDYFKSGVVANLQFYMQFAFKFLLGAVLYMILTRYRGLKQLLAASLQRKFLTGEIRLRFVRKVEYTASTLKKTVDLFNEMFGWAMFFIISFTAIEVLNNIDFAIFHNDHLTLWQVVVLNVGEVAWIFVGTTLLILLCDAIYRTADEIHSLTFDLRVLFLSEHYKLQELSKFVQRNKPMFSAANFFVIDKSTILKMLATVSTFLIIVIEFEKQ